MARQFCLDLSRVHATFRHGDITAHIAWFGDDLTPCLVLVPAHAEGHERVTPCIVPLRAAWVWSEAIGDGRHCALTAHQFCHHLRINPSMQANFRITSIIRDHLQDLLTAPPCPYERVVVADAIRTGSDGRQHHSEIEERL
jgi:hypothetical protein